MAETAARLLRTEHPWLVQHAFVLAFRNPRAMRMAQRVALRHLRKSIPDPALRQKLTPDWTMGCKRILLSNEYLPALAQPNVEVVTDAMASASCSTSDPGTSRAASPTTSGMAPMEVAITGVPAAIASMAGSPNPS